MSLDNFPKQINNKENIKEELNLKCLNDIKNLITRLDERKIDKQEFYKKHKNEIDNCIIDIIGCDGSYSLIMDNGIDAYYDLCRFHIECAQKMDLFKINKQEFYKEHKEEIDKKIIHDMTLLGDSEIIKCLEINEQEFYQEHKEEIDEIMEQRKNKIK